MKKGLLLPIVAVVALVLGWVVRGLVGKDDVTHWGAKDWIAVVSLCLAVGSLCFNWFQWRWGEKEKRNSLNDIDSTYSSLYGMAQATDRILRQMDVPARAREDVNYINGEINGLRRRLSTLAQNEYRRLPRAVHPASHVGADSVPSE